MDSVPEAFIPSISHSHSSIVSVGDTIKLSQSCENELYQLDCLRSLSGESK